MPWSGGYHDVICLSGFQRMLQLALEAALLTITIHRKCELISYNLKGQHYKIIHYIIISQTRKRHRNGMKNGSDKGEMLRKRGICS